MRIVALDARLESHRLESEKLIQFLETGAMASQSESVQQQIRNVCRAQMKLRDELEFLQSLILRVKD